MVGKISARVNGTLTQICTRSREKTVHQFGLSMQNFRADLKEPINVRNMRHFWLKIPLEKL